MNIRDYIGEGTKILSLSREWRGKVERKPRDEGTRSDAYTREV